MSSVGGTRRSYDSGKASDRGAPIDGGWFCIGLELRDVGMEPISSTSGGDAQHDFMRDMQAPKRHVSREMVSDGLFAAKEDLDTYEEPEVDLKMR